MWMHNKHLWKSRTDFDNVLYRIGGGGDGGDLAVYADCILSGERLNLFFKRISICLGHKTFGRNVKCSVKISNSYLKHPLM